MNHGSISHCSVIKKIYTLKIILKRISEGTSLVLRHSIENIGQYVWYMYIIINVSMGVSSATEIELDLHEVQRPANK